MPPKYAMSLMKDRKNKITGQDEKDIHENDFEYLLESYENACGIAKVYNWNHVYCVKDEKIRNIADIHKDIYSIVMQAIK
jgi:dTMP kinase